MKKRLHVEWVSAEPGLWTTRWPFFTSRCLMHWDERYIDLGWPQWGLLRIWWGVGGVH